jgi:hypothetical protein
MDQFGFIDSRDSAHMNAFAAIALRLSDKQFEANKYIYPVYHILFKPFIWWFKNPDFRFHNAEGWRQRFYEKVLIHIGWNPYCSLNPDQCDPTIVYACMTENHKFIWKFIIGMVCKLGFFGNNGEHILYKLPIVSPITRLYKLRPLYWFFDMWEYFSSTISIKRSIKEETTCKIRLYLYLMYAEINNQETSWTKKIKNAILNSEEMKPYFTIGCSRVSLLELYFRNVFREYWFEGHVVYQNMPYNLLK